MAQVINAASIVTLRSMANPATTEPLFGNRRRPPNRAPASDRRRTPVATVITAVRPARISTPWCARRQAIGNDQKDRICIVGRALAATSSGMFIRSSTIRSYSGVSDTNRPIAVTRRPRTSVKRRIRRKASTSVERATEASRSIMMGASTRSARLNATPYAARASSGSPVRPSPMLMMDGSRTIITILAASGSHRVSICRRVGPVSVDPWSRVSAASILALVILGHAPGPG